jgi:hypothetical protein
MLRFSDYYGRGKQNFIADKTNRIILFFMTFAPEFHFLSRSKVN